MPTLQRRIPSAKLSWRSEQIHPAVGDLRVNASPNGEATTIWAMR